MKQLLEEISQCQICAHALTNGPRPIIQAHPESKIAIIGQAPGKKVHETGIPWDDPSGVRLRKWLAITSEEFYNPKSFAFLPIGFCYPGKGKSGDLPPRPECAPQWHQKLLDQMPNIKLYLLIGRYAQKYYLKEKFRKSLTENVKSHQTFLPKMLPLPHPSPRNIRWFKDNFWFEDALLPILREKVSFILNIDSH